jgi:hypothetical protein
MTEQPRSSPRRLVLPDVFHARPLALSFVLVVIFIVAAGARLYRLDAPGVLVDRDYTSAVFARDYFFQHSSSVPPWRKDMARLLHQNQPILEPPVTEWLASLIYRVTDAESLRAARVLTSAFWLIGGIFFYKTVKSLASTDAAVFATGYYLLAPMSVLISRSFQADALMMLLFVMTLFLIVRYWDRPGSGTLAVAAATSGVAILYRPLVVFALLASFASLAIQRQGLRKAIVDRQSWIFAFISVAPAFFYYGYGTFVGQYFGWKLQVSFRPYLLLHGEFWQGWRTLALLAVGYAFLAASMAGAFLLQGAARALTLGLAIGYCLFGLVFTMHIHTHGYYHAQLIPLVAIAASPLVTLVVRELKMAVNARYWWVPIAGSVLLGCYASAREVQQELGRPVRYETPAVARRIGELVGHSTRVALLSPYYGLPLEYNGELSGVYWPRRIGYWLYRNRDDRELSIRERWDALPFAPDYFVVTDFREFDQHHEDLRQYLEQACSLVERSSDYLVYKGCVRPPATLVTERPTIVAGKAKAILD